ncbi:MAG: histidine--tRNA ligase [Patescibacteria group bacterium]
MPSRPQKSKTKDEERRHLSAPRGMHDVLPMEQPYWERIESVARDLARLYGFGKIGTPILEQTELFLRTNEDTEMVQKEMYTLKTKGGDQLALRPEHTAPKMRAYLEHGMSRMGQPQKLWNFGHVFRHDRPQLGRLRQFSQIDFDIIGGQNDPIYDAQIISIFAALLAGLKIKNTVLKLNSIGCRVCRPIYKKQLQAFYKNYKKELCEECDRRLETNPLRLLDCKKEGCVKLKADAPNFLDKLCLTCSTHFKGVLEYLDELKISYALDHQLVRGLDYYSRTVFEFYVDGPGSEVGALPAGGRYDYLMEMIGGNLTPAVGAACGVERLIAVMKAQNVEIPPKAIKKVFLAHAGESAKKKALSLMRELQTAGIPVVEAFARDSLKAQLKAADKEKAPFSMILGQKEIHEGTVIIRDMRTGLQDNISLAKVVEEVKKRLK